MRQHNQLSGSPVPPLIMSETPGTNLYTVQARYKNIESRSQLYSYSEHLLYLSRQPKSGENHCGEICQDGDGIDGGPFQSRMNPTWPSQPGADVSHRPPYGSSRWITRSLTDWVDLCLSGG